ncbi:MAG: glycosyl transferase family 1 [Bdellovibrionales bacterium RIFCSPHIGHO2_01_FULL_40_29]|nr:MAG: glycosyl transferase family 1 [Bdellovibrionales bacterium RIFCSPHIGHO2_01_FULL_40_29]OFZ32457.1 MAG: glycosyl transferase family 1 [Bdellovibrionales bacterium RIFCSPHIGHO2_02_FULL_40_15]
MVSFNAVTKQHGTRILYANASFQINPGDKVGLVGPNGAGKTTLFRLLMKEESPDAGSVSVPEKLRLGYFSQNIEEMRGRSVLEEVLSAGNLESLNKEIQALETKLSDPDLTEADMIVTVERYGELQSQFEAVGGYDLESKAQEILGGLGYSNEDMRLDVGKFSGGWKMRVSLAKILLLMPDMLLMDEPTNHLDVESIVWLEQWLKEYKGALLMTSHDREFMNRLCTKTIEVANKALTVYGGNYDFYDREKAIRREQLLAAASRQEDMLAKEEEFIARFAARASHAAQVQSRVKKIDKIDRIEIPPEDRVMNFEWPTPPRGGEEVVKFQNLSKVYDLEDGRRKNVFSNATGLVKRQDRVAVVGVNGAGKSTLLKIITGQTDATAGTCNVGPSISYGYFSQNSLDLLDPKKTILQEVEGRVPNAGLGFIRNLLGSFLFSGEEVEKKVSVLSGGEKSRVLLACILSHPVNFLVLDEPTNHLDIKSREVLLNAIKNFPGTVMMVSHDRYFLKEITTKVFEIDKNELHIIDGDYAHYLEFKSKRAST